jgi:hypothetical protein
MPRYTKTKHLPTPNTPDRKKIAREQASIFVVCSYCFQNKDSLSSGDSHKHCKDVWLDIEHQSQYTLCCCHCIGKRREIL